MSRRRRRVASPLPVTARGAEVRANEGLLRASRPSGPVSGDAMALEEPLRRRRPGQWSRVHRYQVMRFFVRWGLVVLVAAASPALAGRDRQYDATARFPGPCRGAIETTEGRYLGPDTDAPVQRARFCAADYAVRCVRLPDMVPISAWVPSRKEGCE